MNAFLLCQTMTWTVEVSMKSLMVTEMVSDEALGALLPGTHTE